MNPYEMVVLIILIVTVGRIFTSRRRAPKDSIVANIVEPAADTKRTQDEIRVLKERIAVLERIATDNSSAVALDREIEKLR
jgi:hypothetical protein